MWVFFVVILVNIFSYKHSYAGLPEDIQQLSGVNLATLLNDDYGIRATVNALDYDELVTLYGATFEQFSQQYNKRYDTKEEKNHRFRVFCENMIKIEMLRKLEKGTATYGVTKFADISKEEFRKKHMGYKRRHTLSKMHDGHMEDALSPEEPVPTEFDWRDYDAVSPVKDQGDCGSCYAFSVAGNVEGLFAIQNKKLLSLSEQEIVDCDELDFGCDGGLLEQTYDSLKELGGLETEDEYPYLGYQQRCKLKEVKIQVKISGGVNISSNEDKMAKWLIKNGPVSIALNADYLQYYTGGVQWLPHFLCDPEGINHAVLAVGYGEQRTFLTFMNFPYWLIKNSWGTEWGEEGYFRVYRGTGVCGVNLEASSAVIS